MQAAATKPGSYLAARDDRGYDFEESITSDIAAIFLNVTQKKARLGAGEVRILISENEREY